jgi:hypothetical protein
MPSGPRAPMSAFDMITFVMWSSLSMHCSMVVDILSGISFWRKKGSIEVTSWKFR